MGSASGDVAVTPDTEIAFDGVKSLMANAADGNQFLDLTGTTDSGAATGVAQTIATTSGGHYQLSFFVGTADYNGHNSATVDVLLNAAVFQSATNSMIAPGGNTIDWRQFTYEFTAPTNATTLAFLNNTANGTAIAGLDAVELNPVPEPATYVLVASGLAAFTRPAWRRRRRQQLATKKVST